MPSALQIPVSTLVIIDGRSFAEWMELTALKWETAAPPAASPLARSPAGRPRMPPAGCWWGVLVLAPALAVPARQKRRHEGAPERRLSQSKGALLPDDRRWPIARLYLGRHQHSWHRGG